MGGAVASDASGAGGRLDRRERLDQLCARIVDASSTPGSTWSALDGLHRMLMDLSGLDEISVERDTETVGPFGKAIAPTDAARCIYDAPRTAAFTAAVVDEVARRRRDDPTRPVHVLYAGCGPFATLLLPALSRFGPSDLRCTLIDLHGPSVAAVRRVIDGLGFERSIEAVVQADATTYSIPAERPVDVVVAECLQRALSSEPQVAVARNLVGQAGPDVTLIPHRIELSLVRAGRNAGLGEPSRELQRIAGPPVFALDVTSIRQLGPPVAGERLPARTARVTMAIEAPDQLAVATTLHIDRERSLGDYDSGLTHPHPLPSPGHIAVGTQLRLAYDTALPGLVVEEQVGR